MINQRVFLVVLDSVGIGEMPDAAKYKDEGSNTLKAASKSDKFSMPNMQKLGLFNIDNVDCWPQCEAPIGSYARMKEASNGKDTTIGHWEISGVISEKPLPTFPNGFPKELIDKLKEATGREILCNKPYSGTDVIRDYGKEHMETGALIVYTSADSVLQIAAHEDIVPIEQLYSYCEMARQICQGEEWGVGRIIARPFEGEHPFKRTTNRHDYSLEPPRTTILDLLVENGYEVRAVGKINDIFAGKGITDTVRTKNNMEGVDRMLEYSKQDFNGLCFVNLVDYDMLYGHRNDVHGYANALTEFDNRIPEILEALNENDILMITADHGCDPSTTSTDHSREYTPLVIYGNNVRENVNLGTRETFADIGATILDLFNINVSTNGSSMVELIKKTY